MRELIKAFGLLSINQASAVLYGLVRAKLLATLSGPLGVGIISQGASLVQLMRQIASLGISNGFLKLVAESQGKGDKEQINKTVITVFIAFGIFGGFVVVISGLFADQISLWVFDDPRYRGFIVIIAAASWLMVQYGFLEKFFQGMQKWGVVNLEGYKVY